jgi:hypothetical protein
VTGNRKSCGQAETAPAGGVPVIACDESGSEGENLIGANTDVFAHASVALSTESAAECIRETRSRIRSPALEYKANHLLRTKHRPVLEWLLDKDGPIHGHAHVHLTDKTFFVVGKVVDFLVADVAYAESIVRHHDPQAKAMAVTLYRDGPQEFGRELWVAFLQSFIGLMRASSRRGAGMSIDSFFCLVGDLHLASRPGRVHDIMGLLLRARPRVAAFREKLLDNPKLIPPLDPQIPAIIEMVAYWSAGGKFVSIVHDEQPTLTERRIAQLRQILSASSQGRLAGLTFVDSRSDPRVQVADFLAGIARKIASDELNSRGDAELTAMLRPYVDAHSIWGDNRSWRLLIPTSSTQS